MSIELETVKNIALLIFFFLVKKLIKKMELTMNDADFFIRKRW